MDSIGKIIRHALNHDKEIDELDSQGRELELLKVQLESKEKD
jgi:hypothetical protein